MSVGTLTDFVIYPDCIYYSSLECYSGNARIINQRVSYLPNGDALVSGLLQVCINNHWASVCDTGSLSQRFADLACSDIQYNFGSMCSIS